jgi:hypothetical protein
MHAQTKMKNCFLERAHALTHELAQQLHDYRSEASTNGGLALLEMNPEKSHRTSTISII